MRLQDESDCFEKNHAIYLIEAITNRVEMHILNGKLEFRCFNDDLVNYLALSIPLKCNRNELSSLFNQLINLRQRSE